MSFLKPRPGIHNPTEEPTATPNSMELRALAVKDMEQAAGDSVQPDFSSCDETLVDQNQTVVTRSKRKASLERASRSKDKRNIYRNTECFNEQ